MSDPSDFLLRGPDDFVRLDGLCAALLREFRDWLQGDEGGSSGAAAAGQLAHAADRYLRDFVVEFNETGPADHDAARLVRQYAGNWYVIHTLTPSHGELERILDALGQLYRFLGARCVVPPAVAEAASLAASRRDYFHRRLEDFWNLTPEGIPAWRGVDDYRRKGVVC
jgi:hypothetical protein